MFRSIKTKFIFFSTAIILLSVGIPTFFLLQQLNENFNERSLLMLNATLDIVNHSIKHEMKLGKNKNIQSMIDEVSENEAIEHIRIFNADHTVLFASQKNEIGKKINMVSPHHVDFDLKKLSHRHIDLFGNRKIYSAIDPIFNEPGCEKCHGNNPVIAYLDVDTDLTKAEVRFQTGFFHIIFLSLAVVLVLVVSLFSIFNYFINKPLNKFLIAFDKVGNGDFKTRLKMENDDEISTLAQNFNKMVKLLESSKNELEELHFEQLMHADRLTNIGEMTAQLAHEINNYSGIIFSRADYLKLAAETNQALYEFKGDLDVISNQIENISKLTKNILRHSKVSKTEFQKIDLYNVIENAVHTLSPVLKKKGINLELDLSNESALINGDSYQIEQVLVNLINNAAYSIVNNGTIKISLTRKNENISLSIEDSGSGIPNEIREHIFLPFFTTKKDDRGTGLGLFIVKSIVENHQGEINLESSARGTKFIITLKGIDGR